MFYYIFDESFVVPRRAKIEQAVMSWTKTHDIGGEYEQAFSPQQIIEQSVRAANRGYKTIVVIGDDRSLQCCINGVTQTDRDPAIGFIPLTNGTLAAKSLELSGWREAMTNLVGRKLREYQLARRPHGFIFLEEHLRSDLDGGNTIRLTIDGRLKIKTPCDSLTISFRGNESETPHSPFEIEIFSQPQSNLTRTSSAISRFRLPNLVMAQVSSAPPPIVRLPASQIELEQTDRELFLNTAEKLSLPAIIKPSKKTIRLIVGKHLQV